MGFPARGTPTLLCWSVSCRECSGRPSQSRGEGAGQQRECWGVHGSTCVPRFPVERGVLLGTPGLHRPCGETGLAHPHLPSPPVIPDPAQPSWDHCPGPQEVPLPGICQSWLLPFEEADYGLGIRSPMPPTKTWRREGTNVAQSHQQAIFPGIPFSLSVLPSHSPPPHSPPPGHDLTLNQVYF